ncbi:hypothetical protein SPBR_04935 [Sporothrix brasiliensis 5110]|uniref:Uncharacterized protein n=1 Tax=Sporothrix brasiliensis 5110 TaxID=1398154 RepID=A0A0C2IRC0_9PEZI|nr:uncharacterized protein SPBR_04935 [Sporothrix brasiliensis 5110]KIH87562.1 hypothetical protein SPBR_04935 [Sporothrix brasiliensis 5110]
MAPLVLHNVPDDELYIGADGVTRPFAVVGAADERRSARLRRQATATHGSFGRARSRPRAGSVGPGGARVKQQQSKPAVTTTSTMADMMFGSWKREQEQLLQHHHSPQDGPDSQDGHTDDHLDVHSGRSGNASSASGRKVSSGSSAAPANPDDNRDDQQQEAAYQKPQNQPTEVILRGYRSADYQYAALHHYEQIAGRICEDYPRDPPIGSRRYRSSLRDGAARSAATLASNGRSALTPAERQAVMRAASGQHWVKVTFESAQAADAALYASPQRILGHLVTAELYRGVPLSAAEDVAIQDPDALDEYERAAHGGSRGGQGNDHGFGRYSVTSSHTVDSGTVTHDDPFGAESRSSATGSSSATMTGSALRRQAWPASEDGARVDLDNAAAATPPEQQEQAAATAADNEFCQRIPTARRATLKAPELALLPTESTMRRFVKRLPLLHRLTGTIIGNQVPRRENGLFDWEKASLYWKLIWWLDYLFLLFAGEILDANRDE